MKTVRAEDLGEKVLKLLDSEESVLLTRNEKLAAYILSTLDEHDDRRRRFIEITDQIGAERRALGITEEEILADFAAWRRSRRR
ncbi:MAG TPA: hypothetical protein VK009_27730 [Chloroflexota bacterium]|nr:hypothetical protein [Chloroflexota bacterium]